MKRRIKNVFATQDYNCFGCSPYNKDGLQLEFYETDDYVEAEWTPKRCFEGYPGVVHGGIQGVLMDEVAAWTVYIKARCSGVTSRMNVKYRKELDSNQKKILIRGKIKEIQRNICYIVTEILNEKKEICAQAELIYFTFPVEESIKKGHYPENYESFFED